MANYTKTKARQTHVSPGVYSREIEIASANKSLGITKLGLVGETLRGRAFELVEVNSWDAYKKEFGGLNASKFKGSQYPKYELPYIAQSYLKQSQDLTVCRVLGISGYNAGPAWLITASGNELDEEGNPKKKVVAVLRARGDYKKSIMFNKNANNAAECACQRTAYDTLIYRVGEKLEDVTTCDGTTHYNGDAVKIGEYQSIDNFGNECEGYNISSESAGFTINQNNLGEFSIYGTESDGTEFHFPVSLNAQDNHYILNVLGTTPETGDAPLWVESLYDVNLLMDIIAGNVDKIDNKLTFVDVQYTSEYCGTKLVYSMLDRGEESLTKRLVGARFLGNPSALDEEAKESLTVHPFDPRTDKPFVATMVSGGETSGTTDDVYGIVVEGNKLLFDKDGFAIEANSGMTEYDPTEALKLLGRTAEELHIDTKNGVMYATGCELGQIYTVRQTTDKNAKRSMVYCYYPEALVKKVYLNKEGNGYTMDIVPVIDKLIETIPEGPFMFNYNPAKRAIVQLADGYYYRISAGTIKRVTMDMNDYTSPYRHAITPWFVSQVKGDAKRINLNKLFRFHTINDGAEANYELKVSIENIRPDDYMFDVVIRDFNDSDKAPVVLEQYRNCTLRIGDKNYLGLKIGTIDGDFEQRSSYVTVEIASGDAVASSVPCGFLGFPTNIYDGDIVNGTNPCKGLVSPDAAYNTIYDTDLKPRQQYFGISDITGYDVDLFTFKGVVAYTENNVAYLGNGFHMDCRLDPSNYAIGSNTEIFVDGEKGYKFTVVDINNRTENLEGAPVLSNEVTMEDNIYADNKVRKFTTLFYGAFDGWDIYRDQRTNTDDFKLGKYKGIISGINGEGRTFKKIQDAESIGLEEAGITSDYYAYLAAIRKFANPAEIDINLFATPGIDYVNQTSLVNATIDMIEEERADSLYVVTTPDKPSGANNDEASMYTSKEVVDNLEDTEIDSSYSCTYYPWAKVFDETNKQYIYIPPTKDVVRNIAMTDNVAYPWFAPAGLNRGTTDITKAHKKLKLSEEDTLYGGRINFIKSFAKEGQYIWGQKTLMKADEDTMLSRIHVRRLVLRLRKLCAIAALKIVFDPNDPTLQGQIKGAIEGILNAVKDKRGISDGFVRFSSDGTTVSETREITGQIVFKPYQALEYVNLDFIMTDQGFSFADL